MHAHMRGKVALLSSSLCWQASLGLSLAKSSVVVFFKRSYKSGFYVKLPPFQRSNLKMSKYPLSQTQPVSQFSWEAAV